MAEAASIAGDIASTIQSASITHHPDPRHDLNPSTAASVKAPVRISSPSAVAANSSDSSKPTQSSQSQSPSPSAGPDDDEIPISVLRPVPRQQTLPPLPDLRFEQSYLRSIAGCEGNTAAVLWITLRDQVLLALFQGFAWTLLLGGWRHANRAGTFGGRGVGARLRRWWWGVNGWSIPPGAELTRGEKGEMVREFYESG